MSLSTEELIAKARAAHQARMAQHEADKLAKLSKQNQPAETPANFIHFKPSDSTTLVKSVLTQAAQGFIATIQGFTYNKEQTDAIELAMRGKDLCLIGAAGTGKTTTTREIIGQVVKLPHIFQLEASTKYITKDQPAIVVISYTNKAVNNIKKFLPESLKKHCLTIHKLLEFAPLRDPATGKIIGFAPTFNQLNSLPRLALIIWEEASMIGTDLHKMVMDALPIGNKPQEMYLGDLNQLPPIFGPSILGFKLLELPAVELTEVYRQALASPIIEYAHRVREGKGLGFQFELDSKKDKLPKIIDKGEHGKVTFKPWKKKLESYPACLTLASFFCGLIDVPYPNGYNPSTDIILCPFNKSFGTLELNKHIAQKLGQQREEPVFEVLARGTYSYWAVGDKILYDRQEAVITKIIPTSGYIGKPVRQESLTIDRWGRELGAPKVELDENGEEQETNPDFMDDILDGVANMDEEEQKNLASHTLYLQLTDADQEVTINKAGDLNKILFAYAITVHKSQGSEWEKVFLALHHSHNMMLSRELMYTAMTRAKRELYIVMDPGDGNKMDSITWAARRPEIKGVTLAEKAEYFKSVKNKYQQS